MIQLVKHNMKFILQIILIKYDFKTKQKKATGFKSLGLNSWDITQVTSKSQMNFLDKTCKKMSKTQN